MSDQKNPESGYQCDFCLDRFLQNFEGLLSANFAGFPPVEPEIRLSLPIRQKTGVPTPLPEYAGWG